MRGLGEEKWCRASNYWTDSITTPPRSPHYYVQCTGTLLPLGTTVPLLLLLMHTVCVQRLPHPVQAHYFHIAKLCPCYFYYYIKWQNTVWVLQHSTITGTTSTVLLLLYYIQPPTGHTWHRSTHFPIIHFWFNLLSFSLGPQLKPVSYDLRFKSWNHQQECPCVLDTGSGYDTEIIP